MAEQLQERPISCPPTSWEIFIDRVFRGSTLGFAWFSILLVVLIVGGIAYQAAPAISQHGAKALASDKWDPSQGEFGIRAEIWGTVCSSLLGLVIGSAFGVAVAIFLTQDFIPSRVEVVIKNVIELLAAIPSVVYGLGASSWSSPRFAPRANGCTIIWAGFRFSARA